MRQRNIVCLVVDRLRASALGAYGAAGCETRALDRLASQSFLCDQALLAHPDLAEVYRGLWLGEQSLAPAATPPASLAAQMRAAGFWTSLVTDDATIATHPLAAEFDETTPVESVTTGRVVRKLEQTQLARFFAAALEAVERIEERGEGAGTLLWLHCQGMAGPWDAPLELRDSLADEEDPTPPRTADVPSLLLPEDYDPDERLGLTQVYGGQILALDTCVAALLAQLEESGLADNTLFVLLGARGFPLGEHRRVGDIEPILFGELLHVPWLLRFPDGLGRLVRSSALVQPGDLPTTLLDWLQTPHAAPPDSRSLMPLVRGEVDALRDRLAISNAQNDRALRTAAWHALWPAAAPGELYAKPDDRWEFNEVASRLGDMLAQLHAALDQSTELSQTHRLAELPPLDEGLG